MICYINYMNKNKRSLEIGNRHIGTNKTKRSAEYYNREGKTTVFPTDKLQNKDKKLHFSINVSRVTIEKHGVKKNYKRTVGKISGKTLCKWLN